MIWHGVVPSSRPKTEIYGQNTVVRQTRVKRDGEMGACSYLAAFTCQAAAKLLAVLAPVQPSVRVVSKRDWPSVRAASGWPLEPPVARWATAPLPRPGMRNANTPAVAGHVAWAWWPCLSTNLPCAEINQRPSLIRSRVRTRVQVKSRMRLHHATPGLIIRVRDMGSFVPRVALPTCHMSRIRRLMLYQCHPLSDYRLM